MKTRVLSKAEVDTVEAWLNKQNAPGDIKKIFSKIVKLNGFVNDVVLKNKNLARRLLEAMGLAPKSERGSQLDQ